MKETIAILGIRRRGWPVGVIFPTQWNCSRGKNHRHIYMDCTSSINTHPDRYIGCQESTLLEIVINTCTVYILL